MAIPLNLSSTLCWNYPVDETIQIASQYGFQGVEIWAEQVWYHETPVENIVHAKKEHGLGTSFHASSWDLNLCSLNKGIRQQSLEEIKKSLQLAHKLEAFNVTVHPGKRTLTEDWTSWHKEILLESLQELAQYAKELAIILSLEMMEQEKKEFLSHPISMNHFLDQLPVDVCTTFDVAHTPLDEDVLNYYHELRRVNKIHISDSTSTQYHVPLGKGNIQRESLLSMLSEESVPVVLEGFDSSKELNILKANIDFLNYHSIFLQKELEI